MKHIFGAAILVAGCACTADAATVSLSGLVVNSCVLAVPTAGLLVPDALGTTMRSDSGAGARPASLTVVAVGAAPTLTFGAPQTTSSSGATPDSVQYSYSATGSGISRAFAATGSTALSNLIDTFTINGKIERAAGFPSGIYGMTIDVTCGQ